MYVVLLPHPDPTRGEWCAVGKPVPIDLAERVAARIRAEYPANARPRVRIAPAGKL